MADETQFNYRDEQGRARTAKSSAAVPGQAGYVSSALTPDRTRTAQGDAFNAFRGYVGPDGGTFGTNADRGGFETLSGVSADKLGDTSGYGAADWANINRQFGGIANRDQGSIDAGLKADNPFLRRTAAAYSLGRGSEGLSDEDFAKFEAGGADALAPAPVDFSRAYAQSAAEEAANAAAPKANTDPWGRFDDPTAPNNVIKPGQDRLSPRNARMENPNADPFAPFMPNVSPNQQVGQNPGVSFLPGGIQPTTFGGQEGTPPAPPSGVTFTPEAIQPTTFGGQEGPPQAAQAARGFGLGGQAAAAGGNPTGGMSRGFLRPFGGALRRSSMQGFRRPLRPLRPKGVGGAAEPGLMPQTPQF